MQNIHNDDPGCGATVGVLILLAAIYAGSAWLLQYVLGGFGVHISYLVAVATFLLVKVLSPRG